MGCSLAAVHLGDWLCVFFFVLMECFCAASLWSGPRSQQRDSNGAETSSEQSKAVETAAAAAANLFTSPRR